MIYNDISYVFFTVEKKGDNREMGILGGLKRRG